MTANMKNMVNLRCTSQMDNNHLNVPLVYFDTETGGLDENKFDILTFGAVIVRPWEDVVHEREFKLSLPKYRYSQKALEVNNINLDTLRDEGLPPEEFVESIYKVLSKNKDAIFIAHNANFDARYIKATFERYGRGNDYIDVMRSHIDTKAEALNAMRLGLMPKMSSKLEVLANYFNIDTTEHHGALFDSNMCRQLLDKLDNLYVGNPLS